MAHRAQIGRHPEPDGPDAALRAHDHQRHFYRQPQIRPAKRREQVGDPGPRAAVALPLERFRFGNVAADPQHKQGGQDTDREQCPPRDRFGQNGEKAGIDECRQARAEGRAGLHKADAAAAILVANDLTHQYRAGGPLAAEAEPVQAAQDEQLGEILGKGAQEGEDRIPQDRDLQHAHAAEAVGERAGKPAAERRGHDGDGADRAGGAGRHAPYRNDRGHDVAVELLIEAVQGPAAPAGEHRPAFPRGQIAQPGQHRVSPSPLLLVDRPN